MPGIRLISLQQQVVLTNFMQTHPELTNNKASHSRSRDLWVELASQLNAVENGNIRDIAGWRAAKLMKEKAEPKIIVEPVSPSESVVYLDTDPIEEVTVKSEVVNIPQPSTSSGGVLETEKQPRKRTSTEAVPPPGNSVYDWLQEAGSRRLRASEKLTERVDCMATQLNEFTQTLTHEVQQIRMCFQELVGLLKSHLAARSES